MSSLDVAYGATSAQPIVTVTRREVVWTGGIVEIKIPPNAIDGVYKGESGDINYLAFSAGVKEGVIKCHVHTDDTSYRGQKITAAVTIMRKTLSDQRNYLYVDFSPVANSDEVTHRLAIMPSAPGMWAGYDLVFETPPPLCGAIILAAPDAKIVPHVRKQSADAVTSKTSHIATTGDSQLDRLLDEGWQIEREDDNKVLLFKMRRAERINLTHHKSKNANGKRK